MATLSARQIAALIKINPGPWNTKGKQVIAVAVALAESGGRTTVYNGICCYGLWQINYSAHASKIPGRSREAKLRYIRTGMGNLRIAQKVYTERGGSWSPWEVYTTGSYRRHIPAATKAVGGISASEVQQVLASIPGDPPGDWPTPTDPFGPFGDGLPDIPGLDSLEGAAGAIANAFSWIADPHNWLRIGAFLGGGALLIFVGYSLINNTDLGNSMKELALMAATKGRAAGAKMKGAPSGE